MTELDSNSVNYYHMDSDISMTIKAQLYVAEMSQNILKNDALLNQVVASYREHLIARKVIEDIGMDGLGLSENTVEKTAINIVLGVVNASIDKRELEAIRSTARSKISRQCTCITIETKRQRAQERGNGKVFFSTDQTEYLLDITAELRAQRNGILRKGDFSAIAKQMNHHFNTNEFSGTNCRKKEGNIRLQKSKSPV